ncbi:MAG: NUDIX hydrolase [Candidatus Omnitrophota bacterium]|jgi:ADP-ribose pyrophosphatase
MEKPVYKGKLFCLYEKTATLPNGYRARLEVVRHPGAALIVPFVSGRKIIMLRHFRPVIGAYLYELPAGTRAKGESPLSCARRELIEETGFRAVKFLRRGEIYPVPGYSTERIVIFEARELEKAAQQAEADEVIRSFVMDRKEIRRLFKAGKIIDAKTICALSLCGIV